jgi:hypothetical protein
MKNGRKYASEHRPWCHDHSHGDDTCGWWVTAPGLGRVAHILDDADAGPCVMFDGRYFRDHEAQHVMLAVVEAMALVEPNR